MSVLGVVLAAGASERMGGPKALATYRGETFVARALGALREGGCARVLVVVAEPHGAAIEEAIGDEAEVLWNPHPERGQLSSLKRALGVAGEHEAMVVALVDHPRVRPSTVAALIGAHARVRASLARPRYRGAHGHPYLIDRSLFAPLLEADDQQGARPVLSAVPDAASVEVDDPGIRDDLDTGEELRSIGADPPR